MSRIRVAHVITRLCTGGAQQNTFHTVRLANRERYEVDLISGPSGGPEGSIEDEIRAAGGSIIPQPHLLRDVSPVNDLRALSQLTRLMREKRYTIVHTHTSKAGFIGRLAARRAGVPVVVHTPHGNIFDGYFPAWKTKLFVELEGRAARWTDRIIELTQGGIEASLEQGIGRREQYASIFSGIDLARYREVNGRRESLRADLGVSPGDFLVAGVGRLEPVKGFTYFIAAAKLVAETLPQARFVLAGEGSEGDALQTDAASLGDRFRFLGLRDDVPEVMAAADVLVVPSINEGMGRVVLEAGAVGTPVVASDVGGIPEVLRDSVTGVLVPPESPESIARVLVALAGSPERLERMGIASRAHVIPAFGLERMVEQIEALYEEVLEEKQLDAR
ncbi:MAG: glycosyltransferase family 4 protein [Candidatus Hydrogenedentes bacterium]|nr:glycosyltransferase family 4 protein [Candidatus Hydrogenedentota bacterium]